MNDKIVISTISNIYFVIVSFISFILLTLSLIFIILLNGIEIQEIDTPSVKIKQLYIKWNEKINISVKDIQVVKSNNKKSPLTYKKINKIFTQASLFKNWIENIHIHNIVFNDYKGSVKFHHINGGFLNLSSQSQTLISLIKIEDNLLKIKIKKFEDTKTKLTINGSCIVDNQMQTALNLNIGLNNNIALKVNAFANRDTFFYTIDSKNKIKSIKDVVTAFHLPKNLNFWLVDAIDMSYVSLKDVHGWINYNDLENAYKNMYANLYLEKLNYTYDTTLDAIHTQHTKIEYKDGIVYIYPIKAYTYGQYLNKSHLNIDFNTAHETLTLYLKFDGILNEDMLSLLEHYKIKVPFLQKDGLIKNNLKLIVDLITLDVDAKGDFFTKKANFDYLDLNIDIFDTYLTLDNFDIEVKEMFAKYKDIATAKVKAKYDAKKSIGKINFELQTLALDEYNISLSNAPLSAQYSIKPNHDNLSFAKSKWNFYDKTVYVDPISLPFNLTTLDLTIPKTFLEVKDIATFSVLGTSNVKTNKTLLDINLTKLSYNDIQLEQKNLKIHAQYDDNLSVLFHDKSFFSIKDKKFSLQNTSIHLNDSNLQTKSHLEFDKLAQTNVDLHYSTKTHQGLISLSKTTLQNENINVFSMDKELDLELSYRSDKLAIDSKELDINFLLTKDIWVLNTNSLEKLSVYSELLRKNHLTKGKANIYQQDQSSNINFNSSLKYPYKIMVLGKTPIEDYEIYGYISTNQETGKVNINKKVDVIIDDSININMNNIGIDIDELLKAMDTNSSETQDIKPIKLHAKNSFLYVSKDRRAISDTIDLEYKDHVLTALLLHADAEADFKFKNNTFHLYGNNFNDKFMEQLFSLSKFNKGRLDFSLSGTTKKYNGIFHINNTTIKSYKVLNNILAFINTIPSLVTFSLPGYNKYGLKVNNAYMKFSAENDVFDISDIYLNSKEIDILGRGKTNFVNDTIDLQLNLKTDLASTISKIPVVGYILFDEDSMSTSLNITGKLTDPKVESLLAQEIVVAPLNIIKRTLLYPYELLSDINRTVIKENKELTENE